MPPKEPPHLAELVVLEPKVPDDHDEDAWPIIVHRKAEVRAPDGSLVSLLRANFDFHVTVTGEMSVKESDKEPIRPTFKSLKYVPIRIDNCNYYAYGSFPNGDIVIWAAGLSGWHEIRPTPAYSKIHENMVEAVRALYFLIDSYSGGAKVSWDDIFKNYANIHHITPQAAADRYYSHAEFLADRMKKGSDGVRWGQTSIYQHLRVKRPEAFTQQPKRTSPPPAPTMAPKPMAKVQLREVKSRSQSEDLRVKVPLRRAGRSVEAVPKTALLKPVRRPSKVQQSPLLSQVNKTKAREVWKFVQKKTNETLPEVGEMTVETFGRFLFEEYNFESEEEAWRFLLYLAPELVAMMSIPRGRSYDPWTELPIYDELLEAKLPARVKGKIALLELQKRDQPFQGVSDDETPISDESSGEESVVDEREATIRRREAERRSLSSLRPKSNSTYSGKAAKREGRTANIIEDDDDEVMTEDTANEDAMAIDTPSKRKSLSNHEDAFPTQYPSKRFTRSQGNHDPELQDLEFEVQQARSTGLPIRRKASQTTIPAANQALITLISEHVESLDANAPGDIWNCPHTGCIHKVYGASELECKDLIRDHLLDHKERERVDLIRSEEGMTSLPVSNLLRRLREIAERNGGEDMRRLENGMMGLFPAPLQRGGL